MFELIAEETRVVVGVEDGNFFRGHASPVHELGVVTGPVR